MVIGAQGLVVVVVLAATAVAYGRALEAGRHRVAPVRAVALYAGLAAIGVALVGPVERAAHTSFSVHMLQHLLLGVIAPPLVLSGRVGPVLTAGGGRGLRMHAGRLFGRALRLGRRRPWLPLAALVCYTAVWWGWHVPAAYQATLTSTAVHVAEHLTMVAAGMALWAPALRPRALPLWAGPLLLLGASVQGGILAVLLIFADGAWYPALSAVGADDGGALTDQQLGGAMMWVVAGLVYLVAAVTGLVGMLRRDEVVSGRQRTRGPR